MGTRWFCVQKHTWPITRIAVQQFLLVEHKSLTCSVEADNHQLLPAPSREVEWRGFFRGSPQPSFLVPWTALGSSKRSLGRQVNGAAASGSMCGSCSASETSVNLDPSFADSASYSPLTDGPVCAEEKLAYLEGCWCGFQLNQLLLWKERAIFLQHAVLSCAISAFGEGGWLGVVQKTPKTCSSAVSPGAAFGAPDDITGALIHILKTTANGYKLTIILSTLMFYWCTNDEGRPPFSHIDLHFLSPLWTLCHCGLISMYGLWI